MGVELPYIVFVLHCIDCIGLFYYNFNMSGHSKWSNIKHKKEATDKKKSKVFAKLSRLISVAARNEPNIEFNPALKAIVEKAHKNNMPKENIEKAIQKSSDMKDLEELVIEGYGPEGIAVVVKIATDNKNRVIPEIKKIFKDHDAKWADPGSVLWSFRVIDGEYKAKFPQNISEQSSQKLYALIEALEENDDVVDTYTNANDEQV